MPLPQVRLPAARGLRGCSVCETHDPTGEPDAVNPPVRFGERRLETEPRRGVRHRHCESCREQLPPSAYRYRASCRLYNQAAGSPHKQKCPRRFAFWGISVGGFCCCAKWIVILCNLEIKSWWRPPDRRRHKRPYRNMIMGLARLWTTSPGLTFLGSIPFPVLDRAK